MIHVDSKTIIPSVDETLGILRMNNNLMPQYVDYDKLMQLIFFLDQRANTYGKDLFSVIGKPSGVQADGNLKNYLIEHRVDLSAFGTTETGNISLDEESITMALESGKLSDEVINLISLYQKYSKTAKSRSTCMSLLQNPMSEKISCDGHRMLELRPVWAPQNTGRVGMQKPAVQNIQRELQEVLTVPKGYVLLHTDSGQIEPRIVYSVYIRDPQIQALIRLYDDAYFGVLHYVTMPMSDIMSGRMDFEKHEITPEMKENRKNIKTYNNAVMYGSTSNAAGDPIKDALINRIGKHPVRLQLCDRLMGEINRGVNIVKTAFGTPIDITKSAKLTPGNMHSESVTQQKLKLMINNPIQGTAADLMRVSVSEASRIIMTRTKDTYIYNYVHDAGCFCISEDEFDKVKDDLADIVSYDVEGWLPIKAEPEFGRDHGANGLFPDLY